MNYIIRSTQIEIKIPVSIKEEELYKYDPNSDYYQSNPLLILKSEAYIKNSLIPVIQYELYHPINKSKLDLSYCSSTQIEIKIPVSIKEEELYKYDPNSDYYKSICFSATSDEGTDIIINDRIDIYINNNFYLCEDDCNYKGYDNKAKESNCWCKVKREISINNNKINKTRLYENFPKNVSSNIGIIKCYYMVFTKNGIKKNIGSYILFFILFNFFINASVFWLFGYKRFFQKISLVLKRGDIISKSHMNNLVTNKNVENIKTIKKKEYKKVKNNINLKISLNIGKKNKKLKIVKKAKKIKKGKKNDIKYPPIKRIGKIKIIKKKNNILNKNKSNLTYRNIITNDKSNYLLNNSKKIKRKEHNLKIAKNNNIRNSLIKNIDKRIYKNYFNEYEMNNLNYKDALKFDKRTYFQYYLSLIKTKHLIIFTFASGDYNSLTIKIFLFFFSFALYYTVNALFFNDSTMHNIFVEKGKYIFIYQLKKIIYSNIISTAINFLMNMLSLPEKNVIEVKKIINRNNFGQNFSELKKILIIKFIFFYILSFIFLLFFWFYVSCFCIVYQNTQLYLIKNTLISFGLSLIYPFLLYLLPGILRIPALGKRNKNRECMYKLSKLFQII